MKTEFATGLAIESGFLSVFDHIDQQGPMWVGSGERSERAWVGFSTPFTTPPAVHISISMIDANSSNNLRLSLRAEKTTIDGFEAVVSTWSDTRIGRLEVAWTAFGQAVESSSPRWDV